MNRFLSKLSAFAVSGICLLILAFHAHAQSNDQNFPTPVSTNEINGRIKARDIGDSRVTTYYYAFKGVQGDVFINVVTKNFNGDIDVFTADNLRPLTKMVIYADSGQNETGRLVYLRKSEHLLLRIEGRSPDDDPATFRIKFAGSFVALTGQKVEDAPTVGNTGSNDDSSVKVNSVGTIIETKPKIQSVKKSEEIVKPTVVAERSKEKKKEDVTAKIEPKPAKTVNETKPKTGSESKTKIVREPNNDIPVENKTTEIKVDPIIKPAANISPKPKVSPRKKDSTAQTSKQPPPDVKPVDPLANIKLVIQLKDGTVTERPMSEVLKFSVEKGILIVIAKDGNISRYSILDIAKVTIQ